MQKFTMPRLHGSDKEQLDQLKRFLFRLIEELNLAFEQLEQEKERDK